MLPAVAMLAGFAVLVWGADRFVIGAAGTARNLGLSPLFVGLTVVALGTSAPEMLVSAIAAYNGNPGLAIGNALGSNITNCALVLGASALVAPLAFRSPMLTREMPVLFAIMGFAWWLLRDGELGRLSGALLVGGMVPLLWWMARVGGSDDGLADEAPPLPGWTLGRSLGWLAFGFVLLMASSRVVVWGAVEAAGLLGVSDTVIGLSIIALGTSLPELAASVMGALKRQHDIAVGNVIGSNMFNLLVVLGLPGLIAPGAFDPSIVTRDFPVMGAVTVAVFVLAFAGRGPARLGRGGGALLVASFIAYLLLLYDKLP